MKLFIFLSHYKKHVVTSLMTFFFLSMCVFFFVTSQSKPKVLILHSYTPEYTWSEGINEGISRVMKKTSWLTIQYHYMDTKNATSQHKRWAQNSAHKNIEKYDPDIIVAIDDYANSLVAKQYVNRDDVTIIFAGVNGSVKPYGYIGASNVIGIYERKPIKAVVNVISILDEYKGKKSTAIFVSDKSTSAKHDAEYMELQDWGDIEYKGHVAVDSLDEWKAKILELSNNADFILVGAYRKLKLSDAVDNNRNHYAEPEEVAKWTVNNSNSLVLGLNAFNSQDGIPISVGVSPYEQGQFIASSILQVVNEKKPIIPQDFSHPKHFIISINETALEKYSDNLNQMPPIIEAFARATENYFY